MPSADPMRIECDQAGSEQLHRQRAGLAAAQRVRVRMQGQVPRAVNVQDRRIAGSRSEGQLRILVAARSAHVHAERVLAKHFCQSVFTIVGRNEVFDE